MGEYLLRGYIVIGVICMVIEMYRIEKDSYKPRTYEERREYNSMYSIYLISACVLWPLFVFNLIKEHFRK